MIHHVVCFVHCFFSSFMCVFGGFFSVMGFVSGSFGFGGCVMGLFSGFNSIGFICHYVVDTGLNIINGLLSGISCVICHFVNFITGLCCDFRGLLG